MKSAVGQSPRKNRMRSRPATRTASYVNSCFRLFVTAERRNDRLGPSALRVPHLPRRLPMRDLATTIRNLHGDQRPCPATRAEMGGGRNARATSLRACAFPGKSPGDSPSRVAGLPLVLPQSFGATQEPSRFAAPTLKQNAAPGNTKDARHCEETVDEWTCLWKSEEN